jgi:hypothetical protein
MPKIRRSAGEPNFISSNQAIEIPWITPRNDCGTQLVYCSAASTLMPAGFRPKWTFTATKLVGLVEAGDGDFRRSGAYSAKCLSVKAARLRQQELRYAP